MKTKKPLVYKNLGRMKSLKAFLELKGYTVNIHTVHQRSQYPVAYCEMFLNTPDLHGFVRCYTYDSLGVYCEPERLGTAILYADPTEYFIKASRCSIKCEISKHSNEEILGYLEFVMTEEGQKIAVEHGGVIVNDY